MLCAFETELSTKYLETRISRYCLDFVKLGKWVPCHNDMARPHAADGVDMEARC
jgi:hypothetical protein